MALRRLFKAISGNGPSLNQVILIGKVSNNPEIVGTAEHPEFTFHIQTHDRLEGHGLKPRCMTHRISVLRKDVQNKHKTTLKLGSTVFLEGTILYGERTDETGVVHRETTILADDLTVMPDLSIPN